MKQFESLYSSVSHYGVSRETCQRLILFTEILKQWQSVTHLVSANELPLIWNRHILDSIQLIRFLSKDTRQILDFGSGGGFPGVVLALLGNDFKWSVLLVESNARKVAFLRHVSRETDIPFDVIHSRVEDLELSRINFPQYVTARAVSDLKTLIQLSIPFLQKGAIGLFPKGRNVEKELEMARDAWSFNYELFLSVTDPDARIVQITMPS